MSNELIAAENNFDLAPQQSTAYCSFKAETLEEKAKLFNLMNSPDYRISDCINKTIYVKDVYMEVVVCTNEETGEVSNAPRVVVIDKDGVSYQSVSFGILNSVKKLMTIFGTPTWEEPIPIVVKQVSKGKNKIYTFEVVSK